MGVRTIVLAAVVALTLGPSARAALIYWSPLDGNGDALVGRTTSATGRHLPVPDKNGRAGGAVQIGPDDGIYYIAPEPVNSYTAASMSLWVRTDDVMSESGPIWVGTGPYFSMFNENEALGSDRWRVAFYDGVSGFDAVSNAPTPVGTWQHLAATFALGGELRLYVDGVRQSDVQSLAGSRQVVPPGSDTWRIGEFGAGARWFRGAVDDVRIYNHELTPQDVAAMYNAGPAFIPEPSACWLLALACVGLAARRRAGA